MSWSSDPEDPEPEDPEPPPEDPCEPEPEVESFPDRRSSSPDESFPLVRPEPDVEPPEPEPDEPEPEPEEPEPEPGEPDEPEPEPEEPDRSAPSRPESSRPEEVESGPWCEEVEPRCKALRWSSDRSVVRRARGDGDRLAEAFTVAGADVGAAPLTAGVGRGSGVAVAAVGGRWSCTSGGAIHNGVFGAAPTGLMTDQVATTASRPAASTEAAVSAPIRPSRRRSGRPAPARSSDPAIHTTSRPRTSGVRSVLTVPSSTGYDRWRQCPMVLVPRFGGTRLSSPETASGPAGAEPTAPPGSGR